MGMAFLQHLVRMLSRAYLRQISVIFVIFFAEGCVCKPSSPGSWKCIGQRYFIGTSPSDAYTAHRFCIKMKAKLADFGRTPSDFAEKNCGTDLEASRQYWIECQVGQRQIDCTQTAYIRGSFKVSIVLCTDQAYPICESMHPVATTTASPPPPTTTTSSRETTTYSVAFANWQSCNRKCYHFGNGTLSFAELDKVCQSLSASSQPVDFEEKMEHSVETELSTCPLKKRDNVAYWINRRIYEGHIDKDCRTAVFSGTTIHFQTTPCTSEAIPICETNDVSICQNKTSTLKEGWFQVGGQGPFYQLSSDHYTYTYCAAVKYCEAQLNGKIAKNGTYTFMGLLGNELGLTGLRSLDFWVSTPGISCPSIGTDKGFEMHYVGPMVHIRQSKPTSEHYKVLCVNDTSAATTTKSTSPTIKPKSTTTKPTTTTTKPKSTTTKPTTTTPKPTTTTTKPTTTTTKPTTKTNPSTTTTKPTTTTTKPTTTTTKPTTTTTKPTTTTTKPTTTTNPSTTSTKQTITTTKPTSTTTKPTPTTTKPTSTLTKPTTTTTKPTTMTTKPTTTTTKPTTTTTKPTTTTPYPTTTTTKPTTTTTKPTTIKPTTTTTKTTNTITKPTASTLKNSATTSSQMNSTNTTDTMMASNTIGSTWQRIGQEEYYVNYNRQDYKNAEKFCCEKMNASLVMFLSPIMYFTILSKLSLRNNSFWVGAHGMDKIGWTDECLSYIVTNLTMGKSPCQDERFSVCSRIVGGDLSYVLEDPGFQAMIKDMTVMKNTTTKRLRKLTCAKDYRPSARAAGGVGVFIICSVVTLLLLSDCSGIKSNFFNKKKN